MICGLWFSSKQIGLVAELPSAARTEEHGLSVKPSCHGIVNKEEYVRDLGHITALLN